MTNKKTFTIMLKSKRVSLFFLLIIGSCSASAQQTFLQPSTNGRYWQDVNKKPFFINACTAWELPFVYTKQEVTDYLDNRVTNGFNTIQMSAVFSETDKKRYEKAFANDDLLQPIEAYWKQVDWVVEQTTRRGLIVMINPIWKKSINDWIKTNGPEKSRAFGKWFANRYKSNPKVLYFVGGDDYPEPVRDEMDAMGQGIQEVYGGKAIVAYHGRADQSSKEAFPTATWLTYNWTYAYSPVYRKRYPYSENYENWKAFPTLPMQLGEGYYDFGTARNYAPNGITGRWGNRYVVRRQAWWSILSGSVGNAYGAEAIWYHNRDMETWQQAINYESSRDMTRMKKLIDCIQWWTLQPDFDHTFLTGGYGAYMTDDYALAAVSTDGKLAVVYTPIQQTMDIQLPNLGKGKWDVRWYDPTSETFQSVNFAELGAKMGKFKIASPTQNSSGTADWVLLIERK